MNIEEYIMGVVKLTHVHIAATLWPFSGTCYTQEV
jgi:hypothetical protein